jgi:hypothetical protein
LGISYLYPFPLSQIFSQSLDGQPRNCGANENNNNNNNNNVNPPPPPTLEQVLIMQAQMLQTMQQTIANMQQAQGHQPAPQPQPMTNLESFSGPNLLHSLTPSSQWMTMIG